jgi:hypothetical protein
MLSAVPRPENSILTVGMQVSTAAAAADDRRFARRLELWTLPAP